jgi:hypothetical protein
MKNLTKEIILHIFDNFGILPDSKKISILSDHFLLDQKLCFDGEVNENRIWAAQIIEDENLLRVMIADCSTGQTEYCLLLQLDKNPAYACYMSFDDQFGMIAYHFNSSFWGQADVLSQASLLLALERVKLGDPTWQSCTEYHDLFNSLKTFINYSESVRDERA